MASSQEILVLPNVQPTEEFYEILPLIGGEIESFYKGRGPRSLRHPRLQRIRQRAPRGLEGDGKGSAIKVREYTREDERRLVLVFDASLSARRRKALAQFEKGVNFCACLAWHFYEIDAQMQFIADGFETLMSPAGEIIYPVLE